MRLFLKPFGNRFFESIILRELRYYYQRIYDTARRIYIREETSKSIGAHFSDKISWNLFFYDTFFVAIESGTIEKGWCSSIQEILIQTWNYRNRLKLDHFSSHNLKSHWLCKSYWTLSTYTKDNGTSHKICYAKRNQTTSKTFLETIN